MNINGFENNMNYLNSEELSFLTKNSKEEINEELLEEIETSLYEFSKLLVEKVKTKRTSLGLTQEGLSKISKVNRTTIAKLESYQRIIMNINVIIKLLDSLDLKLNIIEK